MARNLGGQWTLHKLDILEKYLESYLTAMKNQPFKLGYIDAFAGDGSIQLATSSDDLREEVESLIHGSTRRALSLNPGFDGYVFIEKDENAADALRQLQREFPDKKIRIKTGDANEHIIDICQNNDWKKRRAVLFLDPTGMQVEWKTMEAIAATKAIDVWIWFPLGVGVNRLLVRSGEINPVWEDKLDHVFGTSEWKAEFFEVKQSHTLFGDESHTVKTATPQIIAEYYNRRLSSIFPAVAPNPRIMRNSRNSPIYLLCFAAANPRGGKIAVSIAEHLLSDVGSKFD